MAKGKERKMQRLAHLESHPIYKPADLVEWYELRRWVLDEGLLDEYREQDYFAKMEEITIIQPIPKRPNILKRIFYYLFSDKT